MVGICLKKHCRVEPVLVRLARQLDVQLRGNQLGVVELGLGRRLQIPVHGVRQKRLQALLELLDEGVPHPSIADPLVLDSQRLFQSRRNVQFERHLDAGIYQIEGHCLMPEGGVVHLP